MKKVRITGLISIIIGVLGLALSNGYGFLFGILTGFGIGWFLTGKYIVMSNNLREK